MKINKLMMALILVAAIISPLIVPSNYFITFAKAATVKLNKTTLTIDVGKTAQLHITGTKSTVIWKSSNIKVATISSKGKVEAKVAGNANIIASVAKKTFTCKVTVNKVEDKIKTVKSGDVTFTYSNTYTAKASTTKDDGGKVYYHCVFSTAKDTSTKVAEIKSTNASLYPWFILNPW